MATRAAFSIPAGLKLEVTAETIEIEHDGDVDIEQDLGRKFKSIRVTGNLSIKLDTITGELHAGGTLTLQGDVDAGHIHANEVVLGRQTVKCRAITAGERLTIGAATLACDVISAPEVIIDPKASGRVTIIQSHNERGATKIKGGFGLADYEDMFGDAAGFLAQRGVAPLAAAGSPPAPAPTPVTSSVKPAPSRESAPRKAAPALEKQPEDEDVDDPLSLSLDDLEPLVESGGAPPTNDEMHQRLSDALGRITACYEGTDLPPAVEELKDLVEQRDYDALKQNITEVWNGLLGFHQKRGIRPHHQVTHAFNVIHGLVQS